MRQTDVNNSIEDFNDFFTLVMASTAAAVNSLDVSSAEIAHREIKVSKSRTAPFPKDKSVTVLCIFPLVECHDEARTCFSYNFSSSKALVFHGNVMTKKRSRLTCDDVEELVYLHKVCPQLREWGTVKKMHLK